MTPIPPIPEDLQSQYKLHQKWLDLPVPERSSPSSGVEAILRSDWIQFARRIANLTAALSAMTEDRDLWQGEHNEDCPNQVKVDALEAEITRLKAPVTDEEFEPFGYMHTMREKFDEIIRSRAAIKEDQ